MKQKSFLKPSKKEHGGILSEGSRRSRRPLSTRTPIHITLRSEFAYGSRSLLKHKTQIRILLNKSAKLFGIRVYRYALCGNHLHLLIRGQTREDLQNFFRVFCGHTAQQILRQFPITAAERNRVTKARGGAPSRKTGGAPSKPKHPKNIRKFWALLVYSRIVTWGREYTYVAKYIEQNVLEALNIIAYRPRKSRFSTA